MKHTIIAILLLMIANANVQAQNVDELKRKIYQAEQSNPMMYLNTKGVYWRVNLVGNTVVVAEVENKASFSTFKDLKFKATFYSRTKSIVGTDIFTIYDWVNSGGTLKIREEITGYYKNAVNMNLELISVVGE